MMLRSASLASKDGIRAKALERNPSKSTGTGHRPSNHKKYVRVTAKPAHASMEERILHDNGDLFRMPGPV